MNFLVMSLKQKNNSNKIRNEFFAHLIYEGEQIKKKNKKEILWKE